MRRSLKLIVQKVTIHKTGRLQKRVKVNSLLKISAHSSAHRHRYLMQPVYKIPTKLKKIGETLRCLGIAQLKILSRFSNRINSRNLTVLAAKFTLIRTSRKKLSKRWLLNYRRQKNYKLSCRL